MGCRRSSLDEAPSPSEWNEPGGGTQAKAAAEGKKTRSLEGEKVQPGMVGRQGEKHGMGGMPMPCSKGSTSLGMGQREGGDAMMPLQACRPV